MGHVLQIAPSSERALAVAPRRRAQMPNTPLRFPPAPVERHNALVLWHLLSLDAPSVATLWTAFLAHSNGLQLPASSLMAMFVAVWLLYAGDRLLDTRPSSHGTGEIEARHRFHARHRAAFMTGIAGAVVILAILLPALPAASVRLYLIEGSLLAGYFLLIHSQLLHFPAVHAARTSPRVPKELAVGVFFAAATFIPTISREPSLRSAMLLPAALLIALCSLNCLYIRHWEHPGSTGAPLPTRLALRHLRALSLLVFLVALATAGFKPPAARTIAGAIAASVTLLLALDVCRNRLAATTLRAASDLALLTPALFLAFP